MRLLLDTQIFIVLAQTGIDGVSTRPRKLIEDEENDLLLSVVSITETAVKAGINKLAITAREFSKACEDLRVIVIPFERQHAIRMFDLPLHHRDPFDRMLIATALAEDLPIIAKDAAFKAYRGLRVIS